VGNEKLLILATGTPIMEMSKSVQVEPDRICAKAAFFWQTMVN
jgi:hypothetical protein